MSLYILIFQEHRPFSNFTRPYGTSQPHSWKLHKASSSSLDIHFPQLPSSPLQCFCRSHTVFCLLSHLVSLHLLASDWYFELHYYYFIIHLARYFDIVLMSGICLHSPVKDGQRSLLFSTLSETRSQASPDSRDYAQQSGPHSLIARTFIL